MYEGCFYNVGDLFSKMQREIAASRIVAKWALNSFESRRLVS